MLCVFQIVFLSNRRSPNLTMNFFIHFLKKSILELLEKVPLSTLNGCRGYTLWIYIIYEDTLWMSLFFYNQGFILLEYLKL